MKYVIWASIYRAAETHQLLVQLEDGVPARYSLIPYNSEINGRVDEAPVAEGTGMSSQSDLFDVFLSHNSKDKTAVRQLFEKLESSYGLRVWYDEEELPPGLPWQPLLEKGIRNSASAAVVVGNDGLAPWEDEEMQAALNLAVRDGRPVIPVLLPTAPHQPDLPLFLSNRTWVDFRGGFTQDKLNRLVWGITGEKPGKPSTGRTQPAELIGTVKQNAVLRLWEEKLEFLQEQEVLSTDPNQKFAIKKSIEHAEQKIREYGGAPTLSLSHKKTALSSVSQSQDEHAATSISTDLKVEPRLFVLGVITLLFALVMVAWGLSVNNLSQSQHWILQWLFPVASGIAAGSFIGSITVKAKGTWPGVVATATGGFALWLITYLLLPKPFANGGGETVVDPDWQASDWQTYYSDEFKDNYARLTESDISEDEQAVDLQRNVYQHVKQVEPRGVAPNIRIVVAHYSHDDETRIKSHNAVVESMNADRVSVERFHIRPSAEGAQQLISRRGKRQLADGRWQISVRELHPGDALWFVVELERTDGIFPSSGDDVPFNLIVY